MGADFPLARSLSSLIWLSAHPMYPAHHANAHSGHVVASPCSPPRAATLEGTRYIYGQANVHDNAYTTHNATWSTRGRTWAYESRAGPDDNNGMGDSNGGGDRQATSWVTWRMGWGRV